MAHHDDVVFLHGDLDLKIIEARSLPNMDNLSERLRRLYAACHQPFATKLRKDLKLIFTCDPYVTVSLAGARVARTRIISNSRNPVWNEHFKIPLAHPVSQVEFKVKDKDMFGAELIGVAAMSAKRIESGELIDEWVTVIGQSGEPHKPDSAIHLQMTFTPCNTNPKYKDGISENYALQESYFPLRHGGRVTLYQDAHVPDGMLPEIGLDRSMNFEHEKCWEDICHSILEAHHLVYIAGWSIYRKVRLVREPTRPLPSGGDLNLGDLLKYKSEEGVRVLLLVWNDKTGVMQTHDEETKKFFKHSSVKCVLSSRYASNKLSNFKQKVVGVVYSHHQKCVIVDTQGQGNNRKITSFIGGLDFSVGRYDTPEHRLFGDLDTVFQDDLYNPTISPGSNGPRQPWHDLHCKIEGPAAYDVLTNFEQRWRKATKWSERTANIWSDWIANIWWELFKKISHWRKATKWSELFKKILHWRWRKATKWSGLFKKLSHWGWRKATKWLEWTANIWSEWLEKISHWSDDHLLKIERISWITSPSSNLPNDHPSLWVSEETDPESWHVQVFRSTIDSGSVKGFPKNVKVAEKQNLVCTKNLVIDRSIQLAYIDAIRSAQHFIYIENQYFLGSSYAWPSYKNAGADNLIPMELALKIVSKIRAKQRFAVYVVIPMWPEGNPSDGHTQEILYWQGQTMQMMYEIVAREIKAAGLNNAHPTDYLNFYCLGNREERGGESDRNTHSSSNGNTDSASEKAGRFMIYVHSKGMIVDDEYVIIGSANINQRSMSGSRDTEIAMGAYQPHHTRTKKNGHPHGQVYGYRMSLWAEHLGTVDNCFNDPESLECVKYVNRLALRNWNRYTDPRFVPLQGHILKYPVEIDADGKVNHLPGHENFPDVGGKVLGEPKKMYGDDLTT